MDLDNNSFVPAAAVAVLLLVAFFVFSGGNKSEHAPKAQKAKAKKETPAIPSEKKPAAAPKAAPKGAPAQGKSSPVEAPKNVVAPAPPAPTQQSVVDTSPKEEKQVSKSKRSTETPEQREARLKRQAASKELKKQEAAESVAVTAVKSPEKQAKKPPVEDVWEVVVDKKKAKAQKPKPEEVPAVVPVAAPKPVVPVNETKSISVDTKRIGALIGPKGATLRSIQDSTGTSIQMPKTTERDAQAEVSKVSISGPAEGVARAISMLNEIASTGVSVALATQGQNSSQPIAASSQSAVSAASAPAAAVPAAAAPAVTVATVDVQTQKMGAIIGPKGATLHAIQDATETQINTNTKATSKGGADSAGLTTVTVSGSQDGVKKAVKAINELATKGYCLLLSGENFQESFIMVDTRYA
jgi:rRNA processing protein Krr1/Pno1